MKLSTMLSTIALVIPLTVSAQEFNITKNLPCDTAQNMFRALEQRYKEVPIFIADTKETKVVLAVNLETATWTMLETDGESACALAFGQGFKTNDAIFRNRNSI
jgi:hypothetical protein